MASPDITAPIWQQRRRVILCAQPGTALARLGWALCAALATWGFLSAGINAAGATPRAVTDLIVEIQSVGLPNLVYAGEPFNVFLRLVNHDNHARNLTVKAGLGGQRVTRSTSLPSGDSASIVLPLKAPMAGSGTGGEIHVTDAAAGQDVIWEEPFLLRSLYGDLTDLRATDDGGLVDRTGVRTVLVNSLEDENRYRRWAPVKWAIRQWRSHALPHVIWAPGGLMGDPSIDKATTVKADTVPRQDGIVGRKTTCIRYDGDPLQAALDVPVRIPQDRRFALCFLWGYDEAAAHLPVQEFVRALDAAVDRVRVHNPEVLVVLATPPPVPGDEGLSAAYAAAVRKVAREHRARMIDLQAKVLAEKNWRSLYTMDGDADVLGFYPSPGGCARLAAWIEEEMP